MAMKNLKASVACLLLAFSCLLSGHVYADVTETTDITLEKAHAIRVSGLDDYYFAARDSLINTFWYRYDDICIYSSSGQYYVTPTSMNTTTNGTWDMRVLDGAGNNMRYRVWWVEQPSFNWQIMRQNQRSSVFNNPDTVSDTCGASGTNAELVVGIVDADFRAVPFGTYTDVMTFLIEPE